MNRRKLAIVAGIILATIALFLLFRPAAAPVEPGGEPVEEHTESDGLLTLTEEQIRTSNISVIAVAKGSAVELVFPATVAADPSSIARIDARAGGVVRSIGKSLGDYVRKGETVARIESADAAALASQLSTARARVTELSAAYERERRLFEANVTARQDLEAATASLSVARSELARAQAASVAAGVSSDGRSLSVTSPLSGRITAAPVLLGSYVGTGDELYRVVNPAGLQIEVALPSRDAARIKPGDEAVLILSDDREIGARVRSVTPSIDADSRSALAILSIPRSIPGLQPGAFLQARIRPSEETDAESISVPEEAVQTFGGDDVVFVRTKNGFQARPVRPGERSAGRVIILSGLQPGMRIAAQNAFLLKAELEKGAAEHDD